MQLSDVAGTPIGAVQRHAGGARENLPGNPGARLSFTTEGIAKWSGAQKDYGFISSAGRRQQHRHLGDGGQLADFGPHAQVEVLCVGEAGPDAVVLLEQAAMAVETAGRFIQIIAKPLG
jgi:hypothetical protein